MPHPQLAIQIKESHHADAPGTYTVQVVLASTANPAITQTQTLTIVLS